MTDNPDLVIKRAGNKSIAISAICDLASFDSDFSAVPFAAMYQEIQACVSRDQYFVCSLRTDKGEYAIGYALYGLFSPQVMAIRAKNLRNLAPEEYRSGDGIGVVQRCAPFGYANEMWTKISAKLVELYAPRQIITLDNMGQGYHNYIDSA